MAKLFEQNRNYVLGDDELNIIGDRDKLGRKIIYRGADQNAWANA